MNKGRLFHVIGLVSYQKAQYPRKKSNTEYMGYRWPRKVSRIRSYLLQRCRWSSSSLRYNRYRFLWKGIISFNCIWYYISFQSRLSNITKNINIYYDFIPCLGQKMGQRITKDARS